MQRTASPDTVSLEEMCAVFDRLQHGVFFWDTDLRMIARNELVCRLYHMDPDFLRPGLDLMDMVRAFPPVEWARNVPPMDWEGPTEAATRRGILESFRSGVSFELCFAQPTPRVLIGNRAVFRESILCTVVTDVTEREETKRAQERQRTYLETLMENMDEGIALLDAEDRCIAYNSRLLEQFDIDPAAVTEGDSVERFIRQIGDVKRLDEARREEVVAARVAEATAREPASHRWTRPVGGGRWLEIKRTRVDDGQIMLVFSDVTERVELARQRTSLKTIVENMNQGVALLDKGGNVVALNRQALDHYRVEPGAFRAGQHVSQFVALHRDVAHLPPDEQERRRAERLDLALTPGTEPRSIRRVLGDGRVLNVTRTPLESGVLITYRDVTEEEEREALLCRAREEAEDASRMKSEFLARMSHELRTPMQGVLGMAALLARTDLDEKQQQSLDIIRASGKHMVRLVEDLLTVSTLDAEGLSLKPEPAWPDTIVAEAIELVRPQAADRGLSLEHCRAPDDAPGLQVDVTRTRQILINLLVNAIRYTRAGGVTIKTASRPADTPDRVLLEITVTDTGIGIPEDKLDTIFERFTQLSAPGEKVTQGVGLGLAIARSLARLMGGDIHVASRVEHGSVFTLRLEAPAVERPVAH